MYKLSVSLSQQLYYTWKSTVLGKHSIQLDIKNKHRIHVLHM